MYIKEKNMGKRISKIVHLAVMALALIALVVFAVLQIVSGITTQMDKIYLAAYILLIFWAGARVVTLAKELRKN